MQVKLDPAVELLIQRLVANGAYESSAVAVNTALRLYFDSAEARRRYDDLKASLVESAAQIERGEWFDAEQVFDELEIELFGKRLADE
jgi:Arc/MetJ-type ribon-helix-helix transcriptional regulator